MAAVMPAVTLPRSRAGAGVAPLRASLATARLPSLAPALRRAPLLRRAAPTLRAAPLRAAAAPQPGDAARAAVTPHVATPPPPPPRAASVAAAVADTRAALPGVDTRFAAALLLSTALLLASPVITALSMHAILAPPGSAAAARSATCLLALAAVYAGEPVVAGVVISSWAAFTQGVILRLRCATSAALLRGWNTRGGGASPKELADKQVETLEACSANNITSGDSGPRAVLKFLGACALLSATSPRLAPLIIAIFVAAVAAISERGGRGAQLAASAAAARESLATHSAAFLLAGTNCRAYGLEAAVAASTKRLGRAAMDARLAEQAHAQGTARRAAHVITLAWCAIQITATVLRDAGAPLSVFELQAALGFTLLLTMSTGGVLVFLRDARVAAQAAAALAQAGAPPAPDAAMEAALTAALAAAGDGSADVALPGVLPSPLRAGKLYTLMGPSGSGKSRVMDALAGQPEGGALGDAVALLAGAPLPARALCAPAWRSRVAYMPQTATTELPPLPVWALLRAGCRQASPALVRSTAQAFGLDKLNLRTPAGTTTTDGAHWTKPLYTARATQLSAGQRQRVALTLFFIKVLATNPILALMDEPTSSLDACSADDVERAIVELRRSHPQLRSAFLVITHAQDSRLRGEAEAELLMGADGVLREAARPGAAAQAHQAVAR
jgi:ABC-type iron transport system FetAB ATPase subunit